MSIAQVAEDLQLTKEIFPNDPEVSKEKITAQQILSKLKIEQNEARISMIANMLATREQSDNISDLHILSIEEIIALITSPSIKKSVYNFTNQVKIESKDSTILRDESRDVTKVDYYISGIHGAKGKKNKINWVNLSELSEGIIMSQLEAKGVSRAPGKKIKIVLHIQYPNDGVYQSGADALLQVIRLADLAAETSSFSIVLDQVPFSVNELSKVLKEVQKEKNKLDVQTREGEKNSPKIDRETLHSTLSKILKTESSRTPTAEYLNRHLDKVVDHVIHNLNIYEIEDIDTIGGYMFEAIVEVELAEPTNQLTKAINKILTNRPENTGYTFELSSQESLRLEELYTMYSRANGYAHVDKLCIGKNGPIQKIAALIEVKKRSGSDISEEHVKQILKASKSIQNFIAWINSHPFLSENERINLGSFSQSLFSNTALIVIEPAQTGDRDQREFKRQDYQFNLVRSSVDSQIINKISERLAVELKDVLGHGHTQQNTP